MIPEAASVLEVKLTTNTTPPPSTPPKLASSPVTSTRPPPPPSGSVSPCSPPPPRPSLRMTAIHPPEEGVDPEAAAGSHLHHSSSHGREIRRRSLALAQMASINTTAANSLRQRNLNSSSLHPSSAYSDNSSSSPSSSYTSRNNPSPDDNYNADLLPLLSPSAQMAQQSPDKPYYPGQEKSLSGIAERSFFLGIALAMGLILMLWSLLLTSSPLWRVPFFLSALSIFHFLEFWTTAKYNTPNATISSFLLASNGRAYFIAHASSFTEALLVGLLFPNRHWAPLHSGPIFILAGLCLVLAGQAVRSAAMIQCGTNFNHTVQHRRARDHELVTTGIYATFRHPSYFGYFWWALGTQLVMGNVVCFFGYAVVLWRFFHHRIAHEEELLVRFFGDEYVQYRKSVGTKIPFI